MGDEPLRDPIQERVDQEYQWGFVTEIEADTIPKGLSEDVVRLISARKGEPEWMLEWRLKAYRAWLEMREPRWPNVHYPKIDYQDIHYFSAPKSMADAPRAWTTWTRRSGAPSTN